MCQFIQHHAFEDPSETLLICKIIVLDLHAIQSIHVKQQKFVKYISHTLIVRCMYFSVAMVVAETGFVSWFMGMGSYHLKF